MIRLLVALASATVLVQPGVGGQTMPSIATLLERHAAARGGADRWRDLTTVRQVVSSDIVTTTRIWAAGRGARIESSSPDYNLHEVRVVAGTQGWVSSSRNGTRSLTSAEVQRVEEDAVFGWELLAPASLGITATVVGADETSQVPSWKLSVRFKSGHGMHVFIHRKTFLEVGREWSQRAPDGSLVSVWQGLDDHRETDGRLFARALNGLPITIDVNLSIDDKWFAR